jgi:hypothetical protein
MNIESCLVADECRGNESRGIPDLGRCNLPGSSAARDVGGKKRIGRGFVGSLLLLLLVDTGVASKCLAVADGEDPKASVRGAPENGDSESRGRPQAAANGQENPGGVEGVARDLTARQLKFGLDRPSIARSFMRRSNGEVIGRPSAGSRRSSALFDALLLPIPDGTLSIWSTAWGQNSDGTRNGVTAWGIITGSTHCLTERQAA